MAKKRIYYSEFRRGLDQEALRPAYLFTGAEAFLKEEGATALVDRALAGGDRSLNLETVYAGSDVSGREVLERALTLPFLAEHRVLVVRQAEKWHAADVKALEEYLARPSPATVLILVSQDERLTQAYWKSAADKLYHVECYPLFDQQVPGWVERRCREHGKAISAEAVRLLIGRSGQNLQDLAQEISKLASYVGAKAAIAAEDVEAAAGYLREDTLQDLNNAVGQADLSLAWRRLETVLEEGIKPPQILGSLAWHFRNLLAARRRLDAGETPDAVVADVRHPKTRQDLLAQIRTYSREAFDGIFEELFKLDSRLKTGKGHWELHAQLALFRICRSLAGAKLR
ncbi:MAG: DNA polymerase III subunit delta [candidate division FCPU426 bacterium]